MDYSDVNFYPMMANPEYSPVSETFSYPDQFDGFSDSLSYSNRDAALGEAAFSPTHRSLSRTAPSPIGHAANGWPSFNPTSFGSMGQRCDSFITAELPNGLASQLSPLPSPTCASPEHVLPVPACSSASGSISPRSLERASPISEASYHQSEAEHLAKPAPRKRGRPRLNRNPGTDGSSTSNGVRRSTCLPHKQVERKYREGLNMEFERLRRTVPTLPQSVEANIMGAAKPSKGMVLAAAIDYIKRIERELDAAVDEIERLGGNVRVGKLENRMGPIRTA